MPSSAAPPSSEVWRGADAPWRRCWYPVAFAQDLGPDEVQAIALYDEPLALFRGPDGAPSIVEDRCPHRAARLSDGTVENGRLECLYHGWQFGGDGRCLHIPQWPASQDIPPKACVPSYTVREAQGLIWLWPGPPEEADDTALPTVPALDAEDCRSIDFAMDLPYEQTFLVENVIDIAHIHVAHDGVRGGGHRHLAAPIEFTLGEPSAEGFDGTFRSIGDGETNPDLQGAKVQWRAPTLVHYTSIYQDDELVSGLALYSLPLGRNRCRLLYRAYSNFWPLRARLRPRWFEHWTQCTILEQDMDVVVGQAAEHQRRQETPQSLWLPIKSSDGFVLAYRRWLDTFAANWPHGVGFRQLRPEDPQAAPPPQRSRRDMHLSLCASCQKADAWLERSKTPLTLGTVLALAVAAATAGSGLSFVMAGLAVFTASTRVLVEKALAQFRD